MLKKGFCVKCNRGALKGTWIPTQFEPAEVKTINTKRGDKTVYKGSCQVCGTPVIVIEGIRKGEHGRGLEEDKGLAQEAGSGAANPNQEQ